MNGTQTARRHYLRGVADEPPPAAESGQARRDGLDWLTPTRTDHRRGIHLDYMRDVTWAVHPSTAKRARLLAAAALIDWQLLDLLGDVRLCVSELVTNAIQHPQWPEGVVCASCFVTVRLRFDPKQYVSVEVEDSDPRPPAWSDPESVPDAAEDHGRGLWLVQHFSDGHDVWPRLAGGKTVRCWWDLPARGLAGPHRMFSGHPATRESPP
jgi:anti-sigma regulatory factor (Ser/Thr protein kinase)